MKKLIVWYPCDFDVRASPDCLWKRAGGKPWQLHSDEMKIPYSCDLSAEDGADSVERQGDHQGQPLF